MVAPVCFKYIVKLMSDVTSLTVAGDFMMSLQCVVGKLSHKKMWS